MYILFTTYTVNIATLQTIPVLRSPSLSYICTSRTEIKVEGSAKIWLKIVFQSAKVRKDRVKKPITTIVKMWHVTDDNTTPQSCIL